MKIFKATVFLYLLAFVCTAFGSGDEAGTASISNVCDKFSQNPLLRQVCNNAFYNNSTFAITDLKALAKNEIWHGEPHQIWDDAFVAALQILDVLPISKSGHKTLAVPPGTYEVTTSFDVHSNVEIVGTGKNRNDQTVVNLQSASQAAALAGVFIAGNFDAKSFIMHLFNPTTRVSQGSSYDPKKFTVTADVARKIGLHLGQLILLRSQIGFVEFRPDANNNGLLDMDDFRPELGTIEKVQKVTRNGNGSFTIETKYGIGDYSGSIFISVPGQMIPVIGPDVPKTPYTLPLDWQDHQISPANAINVYSGHGPEGTAYYLAENTKIHHLHIVANGKWMTWGGCFECEFSDLSIKSATMFSGNGLVHSLIKNIDGQYGYRAIELDYFSFGSLLSNIKMQYTDDLHYPKSDTSPSPAVAFTEGSRYNEVRDSEFIGTAANGQYRDTATVVGFSAGGYNRLINNKFSNYIVSGETLSLRAPWRVKDSDYPYGDLTDAQNPATAKHNCLLFNDFNLINASSSSVLQKSASICSDAVDAKKQLPGDQVFYNNFNDAFAKLFNPRNQSQQAAMNQVNHQTYKMIDLKSYNDAFKKQKEKDLCGPDLFH